MSELYRHTQPGRVIVGIMLPIIIIMFGILLWTHMVGESDIIADATIIGVGALLIVLMWLFSSLTIVVTTGHFEFWLGPGLARNRIPLGRIISAEAVRNKAYTGFGIRYQPGMVIYNVSGFNAIEIVFRKEVGGGTKKIRVGTDDPEPLMSAMNLALGGYTKKKKKRR